MGQWIKIMAPRRTIFPFSFSLFLGENLFGNGAGKLNPSRADSLYNQNTIKEMLHKDFN
jgi:hypothetical protein